MLMRVKHVFLKLLAPKKRNGEAPLQDGVSNVVTQFGQEA